MATGGGERRQTGGAAAAGTSSSPTSDSKGRKEGSGNDVEDFAFDEPEDELEEFDEIGGDSNRVDPEVAVWDEDWDAAGWDDEDVNDEFIRRLQVELSNFKKEFLKSGKAPTAGGGVSKPSSSSS